MFGALGVRVMLFYDGSYFRKGQVYFRYHEKRGWFSLPALHQLIEAYVAECTGSQRALTRLAAAHYYDSRGTARSIDQDQLGKERDFEMALINAGIQTHYLPATQSAVSVLGDGEDEPAMAVAQKGLDVSLALDALDLAHQNRYDVAVLITGDNDFVPLLRKLTAVGKQTMIAHFDFEAWTDSRQHEHPPTRVGRQLLSVASWTLNFNRLVVDTRWRDEMESLFFLPRSQVA